VRNNPLATAKPVSAEKKAGAAPATAVVTDWPKHADGSPDFSKMTSAQRIGYDRVRLNRMMGQR